MSGRTHSDESKKIMSDNNKGENNPMFGQNHSDETRKKYLKLIRVKLLARKLKQ
jgi:hypothetical protein